MIYSPRKIIEFVGCGDSCVEMPELITEPLLYIISAMIVFLMIKISVYTHKAVKLVKHFKFHNVLFGISNR